MSAFYELVRGNLVLSFVFHSQITDDYMEDLCANIKVSYSLHNFFLGFGGFQDGLEFGLNLVSTFRYTA